MPTNEAVDRALRRRSRVSRVLAITFFGGCLIYALTHLFGSGSTSRIDLQYQYVAAACVRDGVSPFDRESYKAKWEEELRKPIRPVAEKGTIPIPPTMSVYLPLSFLPWKTAVRVHDILQTVVLLTMLFFTGGLVKATTGTRPAQPLFWFALGLVCLISSVPATLHLGQVVLWSVTGILGTLYFWHRGQWVPSGICVFFAAFKPPLAVFPLLYVLTRGVIRPILLGGALLVTATALLLAAIPLDGLWTDALESARGYGQSATNRPPQVAGVHSLLSDTSLALPRMAMFAIGAILVIVGARRDQSVSATFSEGLPPRPVLTTTQLAWPFVLTAVFMQTKPYDMVYLAPVIACLAASGRLRSLWFAPGLLVLMRPQNFQALLHRVPYFDTLSSAAHTATYAAIYVLAVLLVFRYFDRKDDPPAIRVRSTG